jgi:hypothetical protein
MHYENLVFGATLDSLSFAMKNGYPVIYSRPRRPTPFETKEEQEWKQACFFLSLSGLLPFSDKITRATLKEGQIEISTSMKRFELSFDHLWVFDDDLRGLPEPKGRTTDDNLVLDWIDVRRGSVHDFDEHDLGSERFMKKIVFPQSCRTDRTGAKDAVVFSTLTKVELKQEQYSELFTRFRTEEVMSELLKTDKLVVESNRREVYPLGRDIHENTHNITFVYEKQERCYNSNSDYLNFVMETLRV